MRAILVTIVAFVLALTLLACDSDGDTGPEPIPDDFCHGVADGTPCDDGSPCTADDVCGAGVCLGRPVEDGLTCDDTDLCTAADACLTGQCVGTAPDCSSSDGPCVAGACDPSTGECAGVPKDDGVACDDSDACTTDDRCQGGACAGDAVQCAPPADPCSEATCDADTGQCVTQAVDEGGVCDDGDPCTTGDVCVEGHCAGEAVDCGALDGQCKVGQCDPGTGACQVAPFPNGTVCEDGNACTHGETCIDGSCGGATQVPDGNLCDDGDPCTEADACAAGTCMGQNKDCSEVATSSCQVGVCDEVTGECVAQAIEDPACLCFQADDGTPCDDGLACTTDDACAGGLCAGQPKDCSTYDDDCNVGLCDPDTGLCTKSALADGEACDDGVACTASDSCAGGVCEGTPLDCSELDGPCQVGVCDVEEGACEIQVSADDSPCEDGDPCTGGDTCLGGTCAAGDLDLCASCYDTEAGGACDDGDACTINTFCLATGTELVCMGQPKTCPDLGLPCQYAACEPETGDCVPVPLPDGLTCNDADPCTVLDVCAAGQCVGTPKGCGAVDTACGKGACHPFTGVCEVEPFEDGTACDDDAPCTVDETCTGGLCGGAPKDCSDAAGPCMAGTCDPATGTCGVPVEDGTPCDDLDVCTAKDECLAGECVGEEICFCVGQPDGTPCDDGHACTEDDQCVADGCAGQPIDCSGLSSTCHVGMCDAATGACVAQTLSDGSPCDDGDGCTEDDACVAGVCGGSPVDCSGVDDQCGVGVCEGAGECVLSPLPDGTPCDDGDACSGNDGCVAGACTGGTNLCGACADLSAGETCDDEDPCTLDTTCVEMSGLLVCTGTAKDCATSGDACNVGACDPATGECAAMPKADGAACDDGDPCTATDGCQAGACAGKDIDMCGEAPVACEAPIPNGKMTTAVPVALTDGAVVVMGWIDPAGESDWYAVDLEQGQLLTVETRPHCGSVLDTQLGVYGPDGAPLATADDDESGSWAALAGFEVPQTGVYHLGLTAYAASGTGGYVLEVLAAFPPPCSSDMDCACPEHKCALGGPDAGQCVLDLAVEAEPDDVPASACAVTVDAPVKGTFADVADVDWYAVALEAGVPVDVGTAAFCGEITDPKVWIYDGAGKTLLASDADGAGGGHALIEGFEAPLSGTYRIKVADENASTGAYVLSVSDARCKTDADCACADQTCDGTADAPGQCVAKLDAPEPLVDAPATIMVGQRVHSTIDAPYDIDEFVVSLAPGTYDFETLYYCGAETDTDLTVIAPGDVLVGTDEDSGEGFNAAVQGVVVGAPGNYLLRIGAYGPGVGEYLVRVQAAD